MTKSRGCSNVSGRNHCNECPCPYIQGAFKYCNCMTVRSHSAVLVKEHTKYRWLRIALKDAHFINQLLNESDVTIYRKNELPIVNTPQNNVQLIFKSKRDRVGKSNYGYCPLSIRKMYNSKWNVAEKSKYRLFICCCTVVDNGFE